MAPNCDADTTTSHQRTILDPLTRLRHAVDHHAVERRAQLALTELGLGDLQLAPVELLLVDALREFLLRHPELRLGLVKRLLRHEGTAVEIDGALVSLPSELQVGPAGADIGCATGARVRRIDAGTLDG